MLIQVPFIVLGILCLGIGVASELSALILDVDLSSLIDVVGLSEPQLRAVFFGSAILFALVGLGLLRLFPRMLPPMGAVGPGGNRSVDEQSRMPHLNDPLQSIHVAVILISAVLLFASLS